MRNIKLLRIEMQNFRCFKDKCIDFKERSIVKGQNGIGKSTLYSALLWCLFDKSTDGSSATNVRPYKKNGKWIDFVNVAVTTTFDVDGRQIAVKKVQKQVWSKSRSIGEQTFKGSENSFFINDIPKTQKDFKDYLAENFIDKETFLLCSNAATFFTKDTKKRRALLMKIARSVTDRDVVGTDEAFKELADLLRDGTTDELIKRSKDTIKRLNGDLSAIPVRIDEQKKMKVEIDLAEQELAKNELTSRINAKVEEIQKVSDSSAEYGKVCDEILQTKFAISDLQNKANAKLSDERAKIKEDIFAAGREFSNKERFVKETVSAIENINLAIGRKLDDISDLGKEYSAVENAQFDENSLFCSLCGQKYPADKQNEINAKFYSDKENRMSEIATKLDGIKCSIEDDKEMVSKNTELVEITKKEMEELDSRLESLNLTLSNLQEVSDLSDDEDYKNLVFSLNSLEAKKSEISTYEQTRSTLVSEKEDLEVELKVVESKIFKATDGNNQIDERIAELKKELRKTSQLIADQERILDLLERFNRKKMSMLEESVNQHFGMVKWKLFNILQNGNTEDICRATVNGIDVEDGLNDSDCLLANVDILQTFQKMNDVQCPVFLDRGESINASRIPQTEGQLIVLCVSDDKEMVVE